jgi:hypothetical protein
MRPSSVGRTDRVVRSNSSAFKRASRRWTIRLTWDGETFSLRAAPTKLPVSAIATISSSPYHSDMIIAPQN